MNLSQKPRRRRLSEQLEDRLLFDADVADFIALDATSCDAEIANPDRPDERAPEIQTISHSTGPAQTDAKPLWGDTTERQRLGKLSPATAPTPNVSLQLPSEAFLNEAFQFTVKFDNTSTTPSDAGFAPYFDLHVPQGIGVNHAAIFGGTLPPIVAGRFNVNGDLVDDGGNPILHPVTGQAVTGTAGDTLLVYQLPFGSFVPEQPDATVLFSATLSKADGASVGTPLDLSAVGFFALGNDPLDNRLTDPPIVGAAVTASVTPTVLQLVKTSDAAEAERSTGPNFPITYTLTLKLAQGETVEQVLVEDVLPHSHVYVPGSLQVNTTGSYSTTEPTAGSPPTPPGNRLAVELGNLTGSGGVDAVISYQAWIDKIDADGKPVLDSSSGDDKTAVNDARVAGVYQSAPIADNDDSTDTTVSQQSLSIQQSVSIVNDTGARGATPGDTLEYVMHLQVSDYFEFADLVLQGTLSDGQRWDDSFQTLFVIREQGLVSSGTFSQTQHSVTKLASGTGATEVRFDLASAISDGVLTGDLFDDAVSDGGTTVEIRFRTVIEEDFTTYFLSGDRSVDAGDPLASSVTVTGRVRDGLSDTQFESDSSGTGVSIVGPAISKSVYAIEGEPDKRNDPIMAGQSITYRLVFSMPTADFENLILTDFLPLPIYKATEVTAFAGGGSSATPPPAGMFSYGPSHTLNQVASATDPPTLAVDGDSNSVRFNFGNFDVVNSHAETIEILFTVTAQDMRFDDGLLLTNQAIATYQLTTTEVRSSNTITQNLAAAPEMTITKGIVSTDGTSPSFTSTPAPTAFASPGDTAIPFTGRITGADLATHPIDANLRDVDAGDRVKVAIAIENSGGADGFNLTIVDALLPQYAVAASGLNLQVHRGDGTALHFTGDLFTTGIEITDPSAAEGAIRKQTDGGSSGSSVIIISYDLELSEDVEINQTYQTSAEIIAYGAIEGGANHADGLPAGSLADDATITVQNVTPQISGQQVRFDFGNLTNAPNDAAPETITIRYTVRTDNTAGNQGEASGTVLSNAARVTWDLNGVTRSTASAVADVIVIEPELELVYVASPHQVDAGDRVTLDLVVRHTASSDTDAFDVILSEHLPIELQHVSLVSAIHSSAGDLSSLFDLSPRTKTITTIAPAGFDLHKGETLTLRVTGVVSQSVNPAQTLTVNADARWTSMDEATAVERTGEGGVNDYRATRATDLHIIRPLTTKELVGTSITDAGNSTTEAVIGELVQYRIRVQIPESTIDDARIIDTLDPGLEFVSVDSLAVTSGGAATSIITADGVPIGPPATYHASVVGQQLTFDFGQIINPDDDNSEIESMEIVYTARVVNAPVNQQSQTLSNHVQFVWTRGGVSAATAVSSATDVTIIEPQLRLDVTVSDHTPSLNQVIRYATTISHTAGSNATAHDLSFLDTLPAGMKLLGVTVTGAALEFDSSDSGSVALLLDSLPVGQTATIRYDVRITDSHAAITNTLQNDAVVQWTSLPDGLYSGNNSERDGDGGHAGQDDYVAQAHETSTIIHPLVEITQSTIATTPAASGTTGNVDITYELTVTSTGNDPLTQIAIDEDFSTLFGNGFVNVVVPPAVIHTTADRPLTLNTAYDGTSINPSIVDNSAGVFNRVLQGESVTIRFTVEVDPDAPGISVDNGSMIAQAQVRAFGEVSGLAAVDLSDDPDRPTNVELDPIADNEPDDPNIHRIPMLGLTKQIIGSPVPSASGVSGNYDVTYQIRIENNGSTPLEELVLVEDLRDHLGRAFVGIVSAPSVMDGDASDVPKLNAEYSGQGTGTSLIDAAESGRLESGQFLVIRLTIEVDPDAPGRRLDSVRDDASGDFETQAVITAKDPATGQMVWDRSDDPTDPTNVDGDPANPDDHSDDDNDPDDPVSLEFVEIGVAKRVTHVQRVGMSSLVTIQIMVENTGTVYLENIELLDDVKSQFGDNFDSVVSAPTIVASSATVDPNLQPGYADNPSQNMFDGSSGRLAPGEQVLVQLVVQVKPTSGQADVHLVNQAMAAGMPVDAAGRPVLNQSNQTIRRVTDWSDSGADPGSNNPNAPGDTGGFDDPTPTSLTYFTFDGFNNFSNPFDVARQYESESTVIPNRLLSQQIPRLVADPIFSGTARPGARILATLYDSDGYQIVSASVFADMGGNWMMQFQGLDQEEEVRVEFEEISTAAETFASTGDSFDALGLPHGQIHYHSLQPWTAYDDRYDFNAVYRGSARQSLAKGHRHANRPIGFGG